MATKYPDEIPTNHFELAERLIHCTFDKIIRIATERRDQLLAQLFDIKQDYLRKEVTRKKQLADLEKMIRHFNEISIQQNEVVKLQEEQIRQTRDEIEKHENEIPIQIPSLITEGLDSLLKQLEKLGSFQDIDVLYRNKTEPIRRIGGKGSKKGELYSPTGLALDGDKIYIADAHNKRIQIFSTEGEFIHEFGKGQLYSPYGIALHNDWVFISDLGLHAVFKFSKTNSKLIKSAKEGVVYNPHGITTDTNGEVLVADCDNNRIAVFSSDLEYIRKIGKDKLRYPRDVKINNNNIFVADTNEINNIHIFSKSGDLLKSFIKLENGEADIFLCFDLCNNIIISDYWGKSINIFTKDGQLIHKIICNLPTGIVANNNFDTICASYSDHVINIY